MTMKRCAVICIAFVAAIHSVFGFAPRRPRSLGRSSVHVHPSIRKIHHSRATSHGAVHVSEKHDTAVPTTTDRPFHEEELLDLNNDESLQKALLGVTPALMALVSAPLPAQAADGAVASALVAYAHYASLLIMAGILVIERLTVKPDMSFEEEELLWKADALYGVVGVILFVSGYYRVVEYGKGWEFYAHEPLFWFKLVLVGILGASSFFPTTIILKRVLEQRQTGTYPEMSEKLASRLTQVINAEILALATIPLTATLMSRGVLYWNDFPFQVGAGVFLFSFGFLGYKYVKEALTWTEDEEVAITTESEE